MRRASGHVENCCPVYASVKNEKSMFEQFVSIVQSAMCGVKDDEVHTKVLISSAARPRAKSSLYLECCNFGIHTYNW